MEQREFIPTDFFTEYETAVKIFDSDKDVLPEPTRIGEIEIVPDRDGDEILTHVSIKGKGVFLPIYVVNDLIDYLTCVSTGALNLEKRIEERETEQHRQELEESKRAGEDI